MVRRPNTFVCIVDLSDFTFLSYCQLFNFLIFNKVLACCKYMFQTHKTFVIFRTQIKMFLMKSKSFPTLHRQQHNCMVLSWMCVEDWQGQKVFS